MTDQNENGDMIKEPAMYKIVIERMKQRGLDTPTTRSHNATNTGKSTVNTPQNEQLVFAAALKLKPRSKEKQALYDKCAK